MGLWGYIKAPFSRGKKSVDNVQQVSDNDTITIAQDDVASEILLPDDNSSSYSTSQTNTNADSVMSPAAQREIAKKNLAGQQVIEIREKCMNFIACKSNLESREEIAPILCGTLTDDRQYMVSKKCFKEMRRLDEAKSETPTSTAILCKNVGSAEAFYTRVRCMRQLSRFKHPLTYTNSAILCQDLTREKQLAQIFKCYRNAMSNTEVAFTSRAAVTVCHFIDERERDDAFNEVVQELKLNGSNGSPIV
jgi:hypothetical protein